MSSIWDLVHERLQEGEIKTKDESFSVFDLKLSWYFACIQSDARTVVIHLFSSLQMIINVGQKLKFHEYWLLAKGWIRSTSERCRCTRFQTFAGAFVFVACKLLGRGFQYIQLSWFNACNIPNLKGKLVSLPHPLEIFPYRAISAKKLVSRAGCQISTWTLYQRADMHVCVHTHACICVWIEASQGKGERTIFSSASRNVPKQSGEKFEKKN